MMYGKWLCAHQYYEKFYDVNEAVQFAPSMMTSRFQRRKGIKTILRNFTDTLFAKKPFVRMRRTLGKLKKENIQTN